MGNKIQFILVFVFVLTVFTEYSFTQEIKANESFGYSAYSNILKLTAIQVAENEITIKVFETGGGDPLMNGNKLILNICEWDYADGNCYTWDTGINIYEVKSISVIDNKCIIKCTEHIVNVNNEQIKTISFKYSISFYFDKDNHLKNKIKIEKSKI